MQYQRIRSGRFVCRPNRFIAHIEMDGIVHICHVKNTGRCQELLVPGAEVYVQETSNPNRKTAFDLIAVRKGERLINMDSQIPNRIFGEWIKNGGLFQHTDRILAEQKWGDSRLDFYLEGDGRKIYAEIKGVTLEEAGAVYFPDAPTQRGTKHLRELCSCVEAGFEAMAVFMIQMENVDFFAPIRRTDPAFADALAMAAKKGVKLLALDCRVTPDSIIANHSVEIRGVV